MLNAPPMSGSLPAMVRDSLPHFPIRCLARGKVNDVLPKPFCQIHSEPAFSASSPPGHEDESILLVR